MKKSKLYAGILATLLSMPLSGCGKNVDCDIPYDHIHLYENSEGISKLIIGEKEEKGEYSWTKKHVKEDETSLIVAKANFLSTKDNIDYILSIVSSFPDSYREEYVYDYIYGSHYGYGFCFHYNGNDWTYGYGYGNVTDWHWDYVWEEIAMDSYTSNKVRDIDYKFKLYKLTSDGEFVPKYFSSFGEVEDGYIYFNKSELVSEIVSDPYYLNPIDYQNNKTR